MIKRIDGSLCKALSGGGVILFLCSLVLFYPQESECGLFGPRPEFQKGMCYVTYAKDKYGSAASDESLKRLADTGATWVAIVTTWYQEDCSATEIAPSGKTPSDSSVIHAIERAHSLGLKVMLKPHLDLMSEVSGGWRGEIACVPDKWDEWFTNYGNFILHYAEMARRYKVEMLCIGTELTSVATMKENLWNEKVIAPIRRVYRGLLTYAANWNEEFQHVKFWDKLDYVGIDAYFPLSENDNPDYEEIKKGWERWVKEIEDFHARVKKPIIFPEVGYCSAANTVKAPWEDMSTKKLNLKLQADCCRALCETFWDKEWFWGVYWWKWGPDARFGGPMNRGFSIQNKPAENIIREWYKKKANRKR